MASTVHVTIRPPGDWEGIGLSEVWGFRQVFSVFLWRNVLSRYRQTFMGPLWYILAPLLRMVVFSLALGTIVGLPSDGVPYTVFTYTALLPWELFATGITRSTISLVTYEHIVSRVYFPRLIIPATEVLTALVDFFISMAVLLIMVVLYGFPLTARLLVIPFLLLVVLMTSLAVGLCFAPLQARYRDVSNILSYGVHFWFLATPVAYSESVLSSRLPDALLRIYRLNPMNDVVEGFRWAFLGTGRAPGLRLAATGLCAAILVLAAVAVFRRTEHSITDLL